ncbi:MAG: hypothetical protein IKB06_02600 [Clostridia bacterium]|nr:hypothetical protein [Clostridia bacterium]MBR2391364.1 hypothetical protein [Clostridia bacterium]
MKDEKLNLNLVDYSDERLFEFRDWIQAQGELVSEEWAEEVKQKTSGDFDPYSFFGARKLKKIAKKYAGQVSGLNYLRELVNTEIAKREKYNEEQRYIGRGQERINESMEEFLRKEESKTKTYKDRLED